MGRSKALAEQYILHYPAAQAILQYLAWERGQYLVIAWQDGFHLSFDLHFDL